MEGDLIRERLRPGWPPPRPVAAHGAVDPLALISHKLQAAQEMYNCGQDMMAEIAKTLGAS